MDFFEAQDRARRKTSGLVLLFLLAVGGTIVAGYATALVLLSYGDSSRPHPDYEYDRSSVGEAAPWWHPQLFLWTATGTLAIVGSASLFKWMQFRSGGSAVAESVGGRLIDSQTTDLRERRLLNVVEEMAIASGVPVPAVYVMDDEPAINAFAAGLKTTDAAVCVTRGTLEKLSRDELQGVIAHEFSHILNGDMSLNVKLGAIVFGILVIGLIGRGILHSLGRGRLIARSSRGGKNKGSGLLLVVAVGLALLIVGYIGYFFGRLIQAAVSRQREFLADASAVQFTRNPLGISGALKKIGGYALGSKILAPLSEQLGHFFFAQGFRSYFGGVWATHPPLEERIRAIDPDWDGKIFEPPTVVDVATESFAAAGLAKPAPATAAGRRFTFDPAQATDRAGALAERHFRTAQTLLDSIPDPLRAATRAPASAAHLVFALLLPVDPPVRSRQLEIICEKSDPAFHAIETLARAADSLDAAARLPLAQLAFPALRQLDPQARAHFLDRLDKLVQTHTSIPPFEYALQKMLRAQLSASARPAEITQYVSFQGVAAEISLVLSIFAQASSRDSAAAFASGAAQLPLIADRLVLHHSLAPKLAALDAALDKLTQSSLPIKKRLLVAAAHVISQDGEITGDEADLYRAVAAVLGVPMPLEAAA